MYTATEPSPAPGRTHPPRLGTALRWGGVVTVAAVVSLAGCVEDAGTTGSQDAAADASGALDGSTAAGDSGRGDGAAFDSTADDVGTGDAAPAPDAGDACSEACDTLARCAPTVCTDLVPSALRAVVAGCPDACAANPAFATVINGAGNCDTVVAFVRDRDAAFDGACQGLPDPETCSEDADCAELGQGARCDDGACRGPQFAACRDAQGCLPGHECRHYDPDPLADGVCVIACADDSACPLSETCQAELGGICYYQICGVDDPDALYSACTLGDDTGGLCYPLAASSAAQGTPGLCIAGGTVPPGGACESLATERTPEDAALRCQGGLCFGDPDGDVRGPALGECAALCDPRDPQCPEGAGCLDFTTPDDPATPGYDETTPVGICYRSDCDARDPAACGDEAGCRVLTLTSPLGRCSPAGEGAAGAPCAANEDCAGNAVCAGDPKVCLVTCDPAAEAPCGPDLSCYTEADWVVGLCFALSAPAP